MQRSTRAAYFVSTALSLSLAAWSAQADPALPGLTNLNFVNFSGSSPKNSFTAVNPAGWTGGNGLIYIASPTAGHDATSGENGTIATYQAPSVIPGLLPYNYVEADGNPHFESGFNFETVTGLTAGTTYTLSFFQAASQQVGFSGTTTNQWIVALGNSGSSLFSASGALPNVPDQNCGANCVFTDTDPTASVAQSTLMNVPSQGLVDWQFTSVSLTAKATTETLSFLAWGNNGNTANLPPMAFLTGVNSAESVLPEPASMAVFGVGLAGLAGVVRRRRVKRSTSN